MRNLFLLLAMILFSFVSHAEVDRYQCSLSNDKDAPKVKALKLKEFKNDILEIPFNQCKLSGPSANFDICQVSSHKLMISVDPTHSILLHKNGKQHFEFACEEVDLTPPQEEEEDEQEEEEEQEQQQEQQEGEPGHGGSNIRMRGIRTDSQR